MVRINNKDGKYIKVMCITNNMYIHMQHWTMLGLFVLSILFGTIMCISLQTQLFKLTHI